MSLLNKVCPLLRCVFFSNFLLGVSSSCLYASDFVGQDGVDQTKNLPSTVLDQNMDMYLMDGEERQRIVLLETNIQKVFEGQGDVLFLVPQDVWTHILFFMSYNDRLHFSSSSKELCVAGRNALMACDLRRLEKRQWTGGLAADTFDNYLFNNILWSMGSQYLSSCSSECQDPWACARVFMKHVNFLKKNFSQYLILTDAIFASLINAKCDINGNIEAVRNIALKNPQSPEKNHLKIVTYVKNEHNNLNDDWQVPTVSSPDLVYRFHHTRMLRLQIANGFNNKKQKLSVAQTLSLWEEILTYSLGIHYLLDLKNAAQLYVNSADSSTLFHEKLTYWMRGLELYDMYFERSHVAAKALNVKDVNHAASAHKKLACLTSSTEQKIESLEKSAELYAQSLDAQPCATTTQNALVVNFRLGLALSDQEKKLIYFKRCVDLYNQFILFESSDDVNTKASKIEKACHEYIARFDQDAFQKLLSIKKSFQLQEKMSVIAVDDDEEELEKTVLNQLEIEKDALMTELRKDQGLYIQKALMLDQMLDMDVARSPSFLRNAALVYEVIGDNARSRELDQVALQLEEKKNEKEPVSDTAGEIFWKLIEAFVRFA